MHPKTKARQHFAFDTVIIYWRKRFGILCIYVCTERTGEKCSQSHTWSDCQECL